MSFLVRTPKIEMTHTKKKSLGDVYASIFHQGLIFLFYLIIKIWGLAYLNLGLIFFVFPYLNVVQFRVFVCLCRSAFDFVTFLQFNSNTNNYILKFKLKTEC